MDIFQLISLFGISIGSYTDIRTLEVPDWINYTLLALGLGGNLLFTLIEKNPDYIISSILGLVAALIFGFMMYFTGQWGGGDSKMLFGLGALLGLSYPFRMDFFVMFLLNLIFAGAFYGMVWILFMSLKHRKKLRPKIAKYMNRYKKKRLFVSVVVLVALAGLMLLKIDSYFKVAFSLILISTYLLNFLLVLVKAVEESVMIRKIDPDRLTEGDWIVDPIKVEGKLIAGPKDLGIKKEQIKKLLKYKRQGKIDKVKVKYGIPFVPSFLIAFLFTLIFEKVLFLPF